ncbi:MAG: lipoprotein-releasing ABC transporter ATP-binding protein LolD [Gammaproteobacteria bacterium]|jgi:lipoprotein-releasing system ATP-binding protein|nr:lipoprotein-releasing ABC transporter ATP-binding protein LolD [Pseudomonadales bacterium]MBT6481423.1 lipoprotein-releasing ABC transporter ATP-binding protein LolD [Gammaproteobacteria bacterium]MDB3908193.1 lipoprotein-releasing ABC transporter ATP-binding protein LolD [Gammaproteobacteria bacterium]MDC0413848.1 lipoprotein-releasing ABC transporter ATP-binding protein LolD [Gammaproteobacteria bacterium]
MNDELIINDDAAVVTCEQLEKTYSQGPQLVHVLKGVNLQVRRGERIAIVGSSGSGKTTLLNLLGGLDLPTAGKVSIAGKDLAKVDETERGLLRNKHLGFVYQFHHLLGEFTALENVCMPLLIAGMSMVDAAERARSMLGRVGLATRVAHKPSELSGGERQRVAIARALVAEPSCVLLDEPTGNLDRNTAIEIHALMNELNTTLQISFIVVTHDEVLASSMQRKLLLADGLLREQ